MRERPQQGRGADDPGPHRGLHPRRRHASGRPGGAGAQWRVEGPGGPRDGRLPAALPRWRRREIRPHPCGLRALGAGGKRLPAKPGGGRDPRSGNPRAQLGGVPVGRRRIRSLGLGLAEFLDRVTLASDTDEIEGAADLSLMTIHCAKGLEFPAVFLVGMEEDVFPNRQARETSEGLEEERRLFYVALTRAKSRLTLTGARRRRMMGQEMLGMPSRFLRELPADVLENPIRWGTELYQSGQGVMGSMRGPRTDGGGSGVASELARIRGFFDRARLEDEDAHPPEDPDTDEGPPASDAGTVSPAPPPPPEVFDGNAWPKGTRIRSPRFGRGVILASSGRGDGLTYTVRFETGEKRIMARFGMLSIDPS
ncbi:MAG: ATP-binding domain-containing protein [Holophagaceae bacterium]|nr:ATP-binding domain-containing protein [Holophagaceae bacterium]